MRDRRDQARAARGREVIPAAHGALAREAALDALVLLANDGTLPLGPGVRRLAVVGPSADPRDLLLGNYHGDPAAPVTALAGIRAVAAAHAVQVDYVRGVTLSGHSRAELSEAVKRARGADAIVALLGLSPRLEGEEGEPDSENPAGDRRELGLPGAQSQLLLSLLRTGRPVVVVLTGGGALALPDAERAPSAVLMSWYSGEQGGRALADVLFGDVSPSGRLPVTFYRSVADLPPFDDYRMTNRTYRYFTGKPEYPFGHGLSYASIAYRDVAASPTPEGGAIIHATLENQGPIVPTAPTSPADEVVLVFATPALRAPGDPLRTLVAFHRVTLAPHQPQPVDLTIPPTAFTRVTPSGTRTPVRGLCDLTIGPTEAVTVAIAPAPSVSRGAAIGLWRSPGRCRPWRPSRP